MVKINCIYLIIKKNIIKTITSWFEKPINIQTKYKLLFTRLILVRLFTSIKITYIILVVTLMSGYYHQSYLGIRYSLILIWEHTNRDTLEIT